MNELQEFLALIGRLIKWIITWTLNLLAICGLFISLIAFWRAIWIIKNMFYMEKFTWHEFRIKSTVHVCLLFVDVCAFFFGFLSLVFPTRIPHFLLIFEQTLSESFSSSNYKGHEYLITWQLRTRLASSFVYGMVDTMCLLLGLCSALIPTRSAAFIRSCTHYKSDYFDDDYSELRACWLQNFVLALGDLIVLPHFVGSLVMFSRMYHLIHGFATVHGDGDPSYTFNEVLSYKSEYRWLSIRCFYAGIIDYICLCFCIASLMSPTRWTSVFRTISSNWADYLRDEYTMSIRWCLVMNFGCALLDYIALIHLLLLPLMFTRYYHIMKRNYTRNECYGQNNLKYQRNIRQWILRNFYLGLADIMALCIAILCFVFVVRIICFFKLFCRFWRQYRQDNYAQWRYAIVINVLLSIIDLVFVVLAVCVVLSLIRTLPLISDMKQHRYADQYNDYKLRYNVQWRCDILKHFALIFIDIFFVPLFICCLLSVYQGIELVHLLQDTKQWNETRMMTIRKQILINFMLLILDIVCTLPLLLVLICTLYRLCFVAQRLRHSWRVYDHNRAIRIRNLDEMGSNLVGVGNETPEVDTISPMRICSAPDHDSGTSSTRKKTPQSVRIDILYNVLLVVFIDIPFVLVSVVVIALTVYRIPKCLALIRESEIEIKNLDAFVADTQVYSILLHCRWRIFEHFVGVLLDIPCLALCLVLMMTLWRSRIMYRILRADVESYAQFRSATVVQTMCLIRDILFVAPCAVIVVTLWRLPILIYHLMSKYRMPRVANDEAIHFTLKRCTLEVPMNGAPMIHIAADKHAAFTLNDDDFDAHCRLFVLNSRLWESVTAIFGAFLSVVVQSQIANVHCAARDMQREIEMTITLQSAPQNMNRDTARQVLEELMGIERGDLPFVLQLEHDTKGVLFVVRASVNDLLRCAAADGTVDIAIDTALSELRALSGQEEEYDAFVDSFWWVVCVEFMHWLIDVVHLAIFVVILCVAPWRWIQCVQLLFESTDAWYVRQHARVMGLLCHSNTIYYKLMDLLFEPMLNDLVKEKFIYTESRWLGKQHIDSEAYFETLCHELEHHWREYVDEFAMEMEMDMDLTNYDSVIYQTDHILREMKPIPNTKHLVQNHFETQNILIYLKLMQCNASVLMMEDKLKWESHAILIEEIHLTETRLRNRLSYLQKAMHKAHHHCNEYAEWKKKNTEDKLICVPSCLFQNDDSIPMYFCDGCRIWYHALCVGQTDENNKNVLSIWHCPHCLSNTVFNIRTLEYLE